MYQSYNYFGDMVALYPRKIQDQAHQKDDSYFGGIILRHGPLDL